jgi:hypothetical protein
MAAIRNLYLKQYWKKKLAEMTSYQSLKRLVSSRASKKLIKKGTISHCVLHEK